jgi:cellulose synthase operon protein C
LAEAAYDAERYDLAASQFRRLTSPAAPPDLAAKGWSGCGWSHFQQGDFASAAEDFQQLCRDFPGSELAAESGMMRARAYQRAGKAAEALDAFLAVARGDQAEQVPLALFEAARLHETLGDRTAALELIDRLTEQHPAFAQIDAALYQRAWLLVDLQRSADAEATFTRLHEHHADSRYWSDAAYRLAERAVRAERFDHARRLVGELLDSPQTSLEIRCHTLYLQAQLAAASERWDDVAAPLERLLEEFPASPLRLPAEYWIAESYFRQRDFEPAEKAFVQLSHEIGDRHDTWLAMIPLRQSQLLLQRSQWDEAHDVAQTIAARFPGFRQQYEADFVIGRCLAARAQFSQARQWYERVIRSPEGGQSETAAMAQWMIGETYMHQRDYAEAVRAFQQVDRLFAYPRWQAAALLQAGKCHQLLGEIDEAQRTFRRLLEQHPETTYAREASIASRTDW